MKRLMMLLVLASVVALGCTEQVHPGYVGMIILPEGLTGDPLQPGRHSCWGRDELVLIETQEQTAKEKLSILAKDDLNFAFDLVVKTRLAATDGGSIKGLLNRQGSLMVQGPGSKRTLKMDVLYKNYVKPVARSVARMIVSKYDTTEIRENREKIQKAINKTLAKDLEGTPVVLVAAYTSNFDYPKVITDAVERKRKKQIEVQEEEARQAMKLLQATNRQDVAKAERTTRALEAEAEAAYMKIIGGALTPAYIERLKVQVEQQRVEALQELYSKVGVGDKVILTGEGSAVPIVGK